MIKLLFKKYSQKIKMKNQKNQITSVVANKFLPLAMAATIFCTMASPALVYADTFDDQINALRAQNNQSQANANQLQVQADSYQDTINKLQSQINTLQASIDGNLAKQADLRNQIAAAEAELARQRIVLGENIRQMYLEGQISTLEMLASSKNLSDFIDKQQYRNSVQSKIQDTLAKITDLKHQLTSQKDQVEQLLKDQQTMQANLSGQQAQQNSLLAFTQAQKDQYTQAIQSNNGQIASLRAQQAAANRRIGGGGIVTAGDPGHGGYPAMWDNISQDSVFDSWGMYNRECVSYTAWKVHQAFTNGQTDRDMPYWGGVGNANQWPGDADRANIPTGSTPRAHSVAISMSGAYGHAMWVESVNGNTIHVSQYNYDLAGHYSEMTINGSGLVYIYF
jgi:peptidoglycan hydrolase CwlO-like protein/surface antigen